MKEVSEQTAKINPVDMSKSTVQILGFTANNTSLGMSPHLLLTDSTTLTARRGASNNTETLVSYEVVEFY